MAKSAKTITQKVTRSTKTGRFVSTKYAKSHKTTTVTGTIKRKKP